LSKSRKKKGEKKEWILEMNEIERKPLVQYEKYKIH
jgi:hypothetical protein